MNIRRAVALIISFFVLWAGMSPAAMAGQTRLLALGSLSWLIDDPSGLFGNPANAAWEESAFVCMDGGVSVTPTSQSSFSDLSFVAPLVLTASGANVLGGQLQLHNNPASPSLSIPTLYLQDSFRFSPRWGMGIALEYLGLPYYLPSETGPAQEGYGCLLGVTGGIVFRPGEKTRIELAVNPYVTSGIIEYVDSVPTLTNDGHPFLNLSGKVSRDINGTTRLVGTYSQTWTGTSFSTARAVNQNIRLGAVYQPDDRYLAAWGVGTTFLMLPRLNKPDQPHWDYWITGALEYRITPLVTFRGGMSTSLSSENQFTYSPSLGLGLKAGQGSFDLAARWNITASSQSYTLSTGYTFGF